MLRLAVVGAGPAGFYTTDALLSRAAKRQPGFEQGLHVHLLEALPVPFGLVRFGVAPDHPEVKVVQNKFDGVLADDRVTFVGNAKLGRDFSVASLLRHFHGVVLSYGASDEHRLPLPGTHLSGALSAREIVGWYNGHPQWALRSDIAERVRRARSAVVIGAGNVAVDIARLLLRSPSELAATDITSHALAALQASSIRQVVMAARRGAAQAAFTTKEIRELLTLNDVVVKLREDALTLNEASQKEIAGNRARQRQLQLLDEVATGLKGNKTGSRSLLLHFQRSPVRVLGNERDGVTGVEFAVTRLVGEPGAQVAELTEEREVVDCDLFISSTGYKSERAAADVPFDEARAIVPNVGGRVVGHPRLFVAGWLKRGPTGILNTTRIDALDTAVAVAEDAPELLRVELPQPSPPAAFPARSPDAPGQTAFVSLQQYQRIDSEECARGALVGKPREKFLSESDMLRVAALCSV